MDDKRKQLADLGIKLPPPPPVISPPGERRPIVELSSSDDVKKLAEEATPHAMREVFNIGMGASGEKPAPEAVRLAALKEVLDRGLGKASQHVEVEISHTDIIKRIQRGRGQIIEADAVEVPDE